MEKSKSAISLRRRALRERVEREKAERKAQKEEIQKFKNIIQSGQEPRTGRGFPGTPSACFRISSNAAELFQKYVCISQTSRDVQVYVSTIVDPETNRPLREPDGSLQLRKELVPTLNGLLATPTSIKRICELKKKPSAFTVSAFHPRCREPVSIQRPLQVDILAFLDPENPLKAISHRTVAIYWPSDKFQVTIPKKNNTSRMQTLRISAGTAGDRILGFAGALYGSESCQGFYCRSTTTSL